MQFDPFRRFFRDDDEDVACSSGMYYPPLPDLFPLETKTRIYFPSRGRTAKFTERRGTPLDGSVGAGRQLWDPRTGSCLSTLYGHKNTVTKVAWNDNGNWLLTSSRDQLIKLYDIRAMRELCSLKGHHKEVTSIAWHPVYETVFASGGMDGTLIYWNIGEREWNAS